MIDLGIAETDISLSLDNLYAINRKIVDPAANRYFFVWEPVRMEIPNAPSMIATPKCHPERDDLREIPAGSTLSVCRTDIEGLKAGDKLRLKNLYDIEIVSIEPLVARCIGGSHEAWCATEEKPRYQIIQWVPDAHVRVVVRAPDRTYAGVGEAGIVDELGNVVQFERFGFVRIDSVDAGRVVAYFAHR
jgi:glutamyl-tRNA synthetase